MMYIDTPEKWLKSRGGRDESDVIEENGALFVLMTNGFGEMVPVYMPTRFQKLFQSTNRPSEA
jgi:hypothetical protein